MRRGRVLHEAAVPAVPALGDLDALVNEGVVDASGTVAAAEAAASASATSAPVNPALLLDMLRRLV